MTIMPEIGLRLAAWRLLAPLRPGLIDKVKARATRETGSALEGTGEFREAGFTATHGEIFAPPIDDSRCIVEIARGGGSARTRTSKDRGRSGFE